MKKILYFAVLGLAAAAALSACTRDDDFLTEKPKTIYTIETAFDKSTQIDAVIASAYNKFIDINTWGEWEWSNTNDNGSATGTKTQGIFHGHGTDVLGPTKGKGSVNALLGNYWALKSDNSNFNNVWNDLYQVASYANLALEGLKVIEDIPSDEAVYLDAQARFFRGWAYLRLAEMFGGVPLVEELNQSVKLDYVRATREETYSFAIEDLKVAVAGLPAYPAQKGRAARGIAGHFLCEAYLGRGIESGNSSDYDLAVSAADAVITAYPIMTSRFGTRSEGSNGDGYPDNGTPRYKADGTPYFDLFCYGNYDYAKGNTESLMIAPGITYADFSAYGGTRVPYGYTCGSAYRDKQWSDAMKEVNNASSPWQGNIDKTLFRDGQLDASINCQAWDIVGSTDYSDEVVWDGYFATDDRNAQNIRYNPVVMDQDSPQYLQVVQKEWLKEEALLTRVSGKVTSLDYWGVDLDHAYMWGALYYFYGRDWYIARSAETYLLRAEAKLRKGDPSGAAADVNAVRARSNATYRYPSVDIYDILDERARELAWEEFRWNTLLRMGSKGSNEVMKTQLEKYSYGTNDTGAFAGQAFPSWTLFPIPETVIELNSELVMEQNFGWD